MSTPKKKPEPQTVANANKNASEALRRTDIMGQNILIHDEVLKRVGNILAALMGHMGELEQEIATLKGDTIPGENVISLPERDTIDPTPVSRIQSPREIILS